MKQPAGKERVTRTSKKELAIDRALNGSIAILFIIALVLGYAIYVQRRPQEGNQPKTSAPAAQQNSAASGSGNTTASVQNLTDAQKDVLIVPGADASDEERQAYFGRVEKAAVDVSVIEVKDCLADPLVLKTKKGNTVTFRNSGDTSVSLNFGEEKSVTVEGGKTKQLVLDFVENEGVNTYHCENLPHPAGLLYLTQ